MPRLDPRRAGARALVHPKGGGTPPRIPPGDAPGQSTDEPLSGELFELDDSLSDAHAACCVAIRLVDHFVAERKLVGEDAEAAVYAVHRVCEHLAAARRWHAEMHDRAVVAGLSRPAAARDEDGAAGAENGWRRRQSRRR